MDSFLRLYEYKFNGKELDSETGFYYYGARYYDPRASIWLSVDPLAEKYPNVNPYAYCLQNPVRFIDPDGRAPFDWYKTINKQGKTTYRWFEGSSKQSGYTRIGASAAVYTYNISGEFIGSISLNKDGSASSSSTLGGSTVVQKNNTSYGAYARSKVESRGGMNFSDGGNNTELAGELPKGGSSLEWYDIGGLLGWINFHLSMEPGKMGKVNPSAKGTNGGGPTIDSQVGSAIDAVGPGTDAVKEVNNVVTKANQEETKAETPAPDFYKINGTYYNSDTYNADGTKKKND